MSATATQPQMGRSQELGGSPKGEVSCNAFKLCIILYRNPISKASFLLQYSITCLRVQNNKLKDQRLSG